jgi:hypothetical protein
MIVAIHQPNYLPWLGYFYKVARADVFVFLDDVQFSKGSYTNRVQILSPGGAKWLTVPVKASLGDTIRELKVGRPDWMPSHLDTLAGMYRAAPAFRAVWPEVRAMILAAVADDLATVNIQLVTALSDRLGFRCRFVRSSDFSLSAASDERLVEIALKLSPGCSYLSGAGAAKYQDPEKFRAAGLGFEYSRFVHPPYAQSAHPGLPGFVPGLSVLDAVFHLGWEPTADMIQRAGA